MQIRDHGFSKLTTTLSIAPEATLRNYGRLAIINPKSDSPRVLFVPRQNVGAKIDLPQGSVELASVSVNKDTKTIRLSFTGDVPTKLATAVAKAINVQELQFGRTGHTTYRFFPEARGLQSHFIMGLNNSEAIKLTQIDEELIEQLEIAVMTDGALEISALADKTAYRLTTQANQLKDGFLPTFSKVDLPDNVEVNAISSRIENDQVVTVYATDKGAYTYQDGEISRLKDLADKKVISLGSFAGRPSQADQMDIEDNVAFAVVEGDHVELLERSLTGKAKATRIETPLALEGWNWGQRPQVAIAADGSHFAGYPGSMVFAQPGQNQAVAMA